MIKEKCVRCGFDKYKGVLHIHHIDHDPNNNSEGNLEVLCANCHLEYHHRSHYKRKRTPNSNQLIFKPFNWCVQPMTDKVVLAKKYLSTQLVDIELQRELTKHVPMR